MLTHLMHTGCQIPIQRIDFERIVIAEGACVEHQEIRLLVGLCFHLLHQTGHFALQGFFNQLVFQSIAQMQHRNRKQRGQAKAQQCKRNDDAGAQPPPGRRCAARRG